MTDESLEQLKPLQISADLPIYQLTLPTPFAVGPIHTYLFDAEPRTLIDTGPSNADARRALQIHLGELGYTFADIDRLIISHAHVDHYGLAGEIAAAGAQVITHPFNIETLTDYERQWQRYAEWYSALLHEAGVPESLRNTVLKATRYMQGCAQPSPVAETLDEGDQIDLAGEDWQVLHCPGHASGLICFFHSDRKLLIGNDHLLANISSNALIEPPPTGSFRRRRSLLDYWASLRRVAEMPIEAVLPGHGPIVTDAPELITTRNQFHERRLERIRTTLAEQPGTLWDVAVALFGPRAEVETFLIVSEVMGHLDVLEVHGELTMDRALTGDLIYRMA